MNNFLDWQWQIQNSIRTVKELRAFLGLGEECFRHGYGDVPADLPFSITPYFASLIDKNRSDCPIFAQVVSSARELEPDKTELRDPLGEVSREKVPHLIHRYPDRVLFLATDRCASYCRFCTRKRWVGQGPSPKKDQQEEAFAYIEKHNSIKEIIFSGGDPLLLSNRRLDELFARAFSIGHIDNIRIHTRMLSFAPMRMDVELASVFKKYNPVYLVTHFNHPREVSQEAIEAIKKLHDSGVSILNQSVLLKSVNDSADTLSTLFRVLVKHRVRPYYLHMCDMVNGAAHFRVPLERAQQIMGELRGHISGLCLPTLMIDIPGGHGKVPVLPSAISHEDDDYIYLTGFMGGRAAYPKR